MSASSSEPTHRPLRDTQRVPEESTTPDLVELEYRGLEAVNRRDLDGLMSFFAPDAVWDMSPMGVGTHEGLAAIRAFMEEWFGSYEQIRMEPEEILDLGNGVVFGVVRQAGQPTGSIGHADMRYAAVSVWQGDLAVCVTNYTDIDEARAAAERLAEERG